MKRTPLLMIVIMGPLLLTSCLMSHQYRVIRHLDAQAGNRRFDPAQFRAIDDYAIKAPEKAAASIETLGDYLARPEWAELERVRAIWRWLTSHIEYDVAKRNYYARRDPAGPAGDLPGLFRAFRAPGPPRRGQSSGGDRLLQGLRVQAGRPRAERPCLERGAHRLTLVPDGHHLRGGGRQQRSYSSANTRSIIFSHRRANSYIPTCPRCPGGSSSRTKYRKGNSKSSPCTGTDISGTDSGRSIPTPRA